LLLIVYYVGFMIVGDLSDYLIGLFVEREFGSQVTVQLFNQSIGAGPSFRRGRRHGLIAVSNFIQTRPGHRA
jgi:hypothetical protein